MGDLRGGPRYSRVPWLDTLADLRAFGPVETTVVHGSEITHGLLIPDPFGRDTTAMLEIHATRGNGNDGGSITLAITNVLTFDVEPVKEKKPFYPPMRPPDDHEEMRNDTGGD